MMPISLNDTLRNHFSKKRERKIGRYSATDIYKIRRGELNVDNFFDTPTLDNDGIKNVFRGLAYEDKLKQILDAEGVKQIRTDEDKQQKYEYPIDDKITLVMMPDFQFEDVIWETKAPATVKEEIPPWYLDQLECQHRITGKRIEFIQFTQPKDGLPPTVTLTFKPSDVRWNNIIKILKDFDKKLREKHETNN